MSAASIAAASTADLARAWSELVGVRSLADVGALSATAQAYALCGFLVALCFVVSIVADNYSQVDKLWSLTPWWYVWIYAANSGGDERLVLMGIVTTIWGIRLTLNFNRRGGYMWPPWLGEEDYRWEHVRKMLDAKNHPALWQLFNLGFICVVQHVLLLFTALPAQVVYVAGSSARPLGALDWVAAAAILGLVVLEGVADNQQFEFQTVKYKILKASGNDRKALPVPYSRGFITSGVWSLSRHPNYFAEQSIWVVLNLFAFSAIGGVAFYYPLLGCVGLIAIFSQSLPLAERITKDKWPLYAQYQAQVPSLFPYGRGAKFAGEEE